MRDPGPRPADPDDHSERSTRMSVITAVVLIAVPTVIGFYLLAGYIVHKTGATTGIADIGRAVAAILSAIYPRS